MDPIYARAIGVDVDELLICQPDTGEQALEITDMLIRSGAIDVVVIDSVAALTPRAEIEGEMGDSHVGLQARLMSQALRKLTANLNKTEHDLHLHQPAAGEDRRHVRLAGDHAGWPGAEVLQLGPARHPAHRVHQGRRRGGRQPHAGEGREEQGGAAVPAGGVRHHVRPGHQPRGSRARHRCRQRHREEVGRLVHLRGRAARPGSGERQAVPPRQPRDHDRDLREDPRRRWASATSRGAGGRGRELDPDDEPISLDD